MTTNLLIAYPDIPFRAFSRSIPTSNVAEDSLYSQGNLVHCKRHNLFRAITSNGTATIELVYDLGASTTAKASYAIVAGANRLMSAGTTDVTLSRSSNGSAYTEEWASGSFSGAFLTGTLGEDYIETFTESSAYRYWKFTLTGGSDGTREFSKLYFGTAFDMARNPDFSFTRPLLNVSEWAVDSGNVRTIRSDYSGYKFSFRWQAVTDAVLESWFNTVVRNQVRHRFFLFTTARHEILDNKYLVHARLINSTHRRVFSDWNEVRADFEEVVA